MRCLTGGHVVCHIGKNNACAGCKGMPHGKLSLPLLNDVSNKKPPAKEMHIVSSWQTGQTIQGSTLHSISADGHTTESCFIQCPANVYRTAKQYRSLSIAK